MKDIKLLIVFQIYGVLTGGSKISVTWTILLILLSFFTTWQTFTFGFDSMSLTKTLSGRTQLFACSFLSLARIASLVSSLWNRKRFTKILKEIEFLDTSMGYREKAFPKLYYKAFVFFTFSFIVLFKNLIKNFGNKHFWDRHFVSSFSLHVVHIKEFSFVFFVDVLKIRLNYLRVLIETSRDPESLQKLHTQIFSLTILINKCYGNILTLNFCQNCYAMIANLFWIFLALAKFEVDDLSRKFAFKVIIQDNYQSFANFQKFSVHFSDIP